MLAATFVHETSRAKDPSLHMAMAPTANVTIDPERHGGPGNELRGNVRDAQDLRCAHPQ